MTTEQSIQPLNVAAATLLVQLLFITLIAIASSLLRSQRWPPPDPSFIRGDPGSPSGSLRNSPTLFVALVSFAVLLISDDLYATWSPIFQGVGINTITAGKAIGLVFALNLFLVTYLMFATGGSATSPFTTALFTLPALAIFLRLPPAMFLSFTAVAAFAYLLLLSPSVPRINIGQAASAFMNIACLLLSIFTGYITRPVPITEMKPASAPFTSPSNQQQASGAQAPAAPK